MKNFKCTLLEKGLHIQGDAENIMGESYPVSLLLSTEEANLPWDDAKEWVKEQGGALPTCAQLQAIQAHRDEINAVLEAEDKETLGGWYWTNEEYQGDPRCALCVYMYYGDVDLISKSPSNFVRSVSAFQI